MAISHTTTAKAAMTAALVLAQASLWAGTARAAVSDSGSPTQPPPASIGEPEFASGVVEVSPDGVVRVTTGPGRADRIHVHDRTTYAHLQGGEVIVSSTHFILNQIRPGEGCQRHGPFEVSCPNTGRRLTAVRVDTRDGDDTVTFTTDFITGQASTLRSLTVVGGGGADRITNSTAIPGILNGGDGDDTVQGGLSRDLIIGGAGDDTLSGGHGDDDLLGEIGNDTLYGEGGRDRLNGGVGRSNVLDGGLESDVCDWAGPDGRRVDCEAGNGS
ncbi:calcium-binding protein [Streptomyces nojiriensis]|uniref:calcium-binding protein n=1 Tax=Streptomyces nojiriensis TaxID=66374 RepID=UPI0036591DB7